MTDFDIRPLAQEDDRSSFDCGQPDLDRFLKGYAGQNQFRHQIGTTWVAVSSGSGAGAARLLGFVTVSATTIEADELPQSVRRRLPSYPLPALRLARLAVDRRDQGRGIGLTLLKTVFILARRMAGDFGCVGVLVDAKIGAVGFYESFGFAALELLKGGLGDRPEPQPMFLPLGSIPEMSAERG